ncbi:hypothetical protein [Paenibacillus rigui]|uniref:Uncharacterized protein n=1 Tax=Paenibacillus rigui TaxID=554312 RepID=A0A229UI90_9BACL|nr:hypothetical protein [Paenibacillus rigui]OXM83015.1 hypothetical protein CF651_27755 [Paenibacillus rigui]
MRDQIAKILCFLLVLNLFIGNGLIESPAASAAVLAGANSVLVDDDFTALDDGTTADSVGYAVYSPTSGKSSAQVYTDANGNKGMYLNVSGVGSSTLSIGKTFTPQTGIVTAQFKFMQPSGARVRNQLITFVSSAGTPVLRIGTENSTSKGFIFWPTPTAMTGAYDVGVWYDIKIEANLVSKKFNFWLNGALAASRQDLELNTDIAKILIGTPSGNGGEYITNLKVTSSSQNDIPKSPAIYSWVPRDQEIGLWFESVTEASYYNIKTRLSSKPNDPWYVLRYNSKNNPTERGSAKNYYVGTTSPRIVNGQSYDIAITSVLQDTRTGKYYESAPTYQNGVVPNASVPVASLSNSIIGDITLFASYYSANWAVKSGINVGDSPFYSSIYKITDLPTKYSKMDWIYTDSRSQTFADKTTMATFPVRDKATVYVAIDDREDVPAWLSSSWTDTGDKIQLDGGAVVLKIYKQTFAANATVTMGTNTTTKTNIGYFVLAERTPVGLTMDPVTSFVNNDNFTVTGSVYETGVTLNVYNNSIQIYSTTLTQSKYAVPIKLSPGVNNLQVTANRSGVKLFDSSVASITYDVTNPALQIAGPPNQVKAAAFTLTGSTNKLSRIQIINNGTAVVDSVYANIKGAFSYPITFSEGMNNLDIINTDQSGNVTKATYSVQYMFWAGKPVYYDLSGSQVASIAPAKDITASKEISNTTATAKEVTLIFVLYDANGTMLKYSMAVANLAPGEKRVLYAGFTMPEVTTGCSLEAFEWNNLDGMKPLSEESLLQ